MNSSNVSKPSATFLPEQVQCHCNKNPIIFLVLRLFKTLHTQTWSLGICMPGKSHEQRRGAMKANLMLLKAHK